MSIAITAEGIGKRYRLGQYVGTGSFRESVSGWFRKTSPKETQDSFVWALRDIDFSVDAGEICGVVGSNGAGKSTLLKLLTGITHPTTGQMELHGRVASLLEVGTGFHGELTGRENIFLNGSILGMRRHEIRAKFDEIVAFSGVERFLDTPVKRYSSGMYMRLAFSVAAHLDQEILLIDEVLAVGDAEFQKKCLGKMDEIAGDGRTVLFVSHNMEAVRRLCPRTIRLAQGQIVDDGPSSTVIDRHLSESLAVAARELDKREDRRGTGRVRVTSIAMLDAQGQQTHHVMTGASPSLELRLSAPAKCHVDLQVRSADGTPLGVLSSRLSGLAAKEPAETFRCVLRDLLLAEGNYLIDFNLWDADDTLIDSLTSAFTLSVQAGDFFSVGYEPSRRQGILLFHQDWTSE